MIDRPHKAPAEPRDHAGPFTRLRAGRPRRAGFALVLTLAFAALTLIAATGYLASYVTDLTQAANLRAAARADYLAGSGVSMALHYLAVPPTTVAAGQHWGGVSGFSIDGSADTIDVALTRSVLAPEQYTIVCTGVARDEDGSIRARKTVTTVVNTPPPKTWSLNKAYLGAGNTQFGSRLTLAGPVHANGTITSTATCLNAVSATGNVTWGGVNYTSGGTYSAAPSGPNSIQPNRAAIVMPPMGTSWWSRYAIHGVVYEAANYGSSSLSATTIGASGGRSLATLVPDLVDPLVNGFTFVDPLALLTGGKAGLGDAVKVVGSLLGVLGVPFTGATMVGPTNPGGVMIVNGDLDVSLSTGFIGTLVVQGRLRVRGLATLSVMSMPRYPALIVTGDLEVEDLGGLTVNGPILVGGRICGNGNFNAIGACLAYGQGTETTLSNGLLASAMIQWNSVYARLYDFSPGSGQPMTLLSWSEP